MGKTKEKYRCQWVKKLKPLEQKKFRKRTFDKQNLYVWEFNSLKPKIMNVFFRPKIELRIKVTIN